MSAHTTDGVDSMVRGLVEAMSDSGEKAVPMATTDTEEVIKSQLTENTGRHLLDSGGAYGRHWEENQDNPPWERPEWDVQESYVTRNVYHYMDRYFDRDRAAVALEVALYAYGYTGPGKGDSWLTCMEEVAAALLEHRPSPGELEAWGLPEEVAHQVAADLPRFDGSEEPMTWNTCNGEWHGLSQVLQGVNFGGPYAEYAMIQVHGGADVRGGYTAPRAYRSRDGWIPHELSYYCPQCDWSEAESVLGYDDDQLLYQRTVDPAELYEALREHTPDDIPDEAVEKYADEAVAEAEDMDMDGAVFHVADGCGGVVRF